MDSRGFRLNNPLCLAWNPANKWQGLDNPPYEAVGKTTPLCRFENPVMGIRAGAVLLIAYQDRHGCDTVSKIIERWAPAGIDDNHTVAYRNFVARRIGMGPNTPINLHDYAMLRPLVEAMIDFENAGDGHPYSDAQIDAGLARAGVTRDAGPPTIKNSRTIKGAAVTTATGATTGIATVATIADQVQDVAGPLGGAVYALKSLAIMVKPILPWVLGAAAVALVGVGIWIAWARIDDWRRGMR